MYVITNSYNSYEDITSYEDIKHLIVYIIKAGFYEGERIYDKQCL